MVQRRIINNILIFFISVYSVISLYSDTLDLDLGVLGKLVNSLFSVSLGDLAYALPIVCVVASIYNIKKPSNNQQRLYIMFVLEIIVVAGIFATLGFNGGVAGNAIFKVGKSLFGSVATLIFISVFIFILVIWNIKDKKQKCKTKTNSFDNYFEDKENTSQTKKDGNIKDDNFIKLPKCDFSEILASPEFYETAEIKTKIILGKDESGKFIATSLQELVHLLIAGATDGGKSGVVNNIICNLISKNSPKEIRLILIDLKAVELSFYDELPHLLTPVVIDKKDVSKTFGLIGSIVQERKILFLKVKAKNIEEYNQKSKIKLPRIVVVIDELFQTLYSKDIENMLLEQASIARFAGITFILATQRPSVRIVSGDIKANIPSRIALAVASGTDSDVILDARGAERLNGFGDFLFNERGKREMIHGQGAWIEPDKIEFIVEKMKEKYGKFKQDEEQPETTQENNNKLDDLTEKAILYALKERAISVSIIRNIFAIGSTRATKILEELESLIVLGEKNSNKPRKVITTLDEWEEIKKNVA